MINEKYILAVYSILILSPLLALPLIVYGIYHQYKGCQTALAVFMAFLAFLTAPVGDLYRHTIFYFMIHNYSFNRFVETVESDFIIQLIEFFMAKYNIPYEFLRLVYTFISYSILNYIFNQLISKSNYKYRKSEYFNRYLLTFICMDFFQLVLGVRYTFAASVFTLAVYYYLCEKKYVLSLPLAILSISIHYSFLYYGFFIFFLLHIRINKQVFAILLLSGFIISEILISQFQSILLEEDMQGAGYLGEGKWAKGYRQAQEFNNVMYSYAKYIACIPATLYALQRVKKGRVYQYFLTLSLILAVTLPLGSIPDRIPTIFFLCVPILILWDESLNRKKMVRKYYCAIYCSIVLIYAATFYGMKNPRFHSEYQYIALPVPYILNHQYDYGWMFRHINNDGSGKYRDE